MLENKNAQVEIIDEYGGTIYLYTHEGAHSLLKDIYEVMLKKKRWDDPGYLSRMIFCNMLPIEKWDDDKGFGIGNRLYEDIVLLATLNMKKGTIKLQLTAEKHECHEMTFEYFIGDFFNNAEL